MRVRRALLVVLASCSLTSAGCAFPDYVFPGRVGDAFAAPDVADALAAPDVADVVDAIDSPPGGPPPTACADIGIALACGTIVEMFSPDLQVLDGKGDEMCAIAPRVFPVESGEHRTPIAKNGAPQQAKVRVGVSARGVHFFVQVLEDPWIVVASDLVQGDAVEIFVRGVHDPITGKLSSDGGRHFVFVPPNDGKSGDGREVRSDGTYGPLSAGYYGIRGVRAGYEVEMRLPWTELGGQPAPGDEMAFDVGIDVSDDEKGPRRVQSFLYYQSVASPTTCTTTTTAEPRCDDRTWCEAFAYHAP
ncbi:MAG: sugar-binding protein [Polyangiales bacterium]